MKNSIADAYAKHKKYLMHMALTMTRRPELAEELVNELFTKIVEKDIVLTAVTARPFLIKGLIFLNGRLNNRSRGVASTKELRGFSYPRKASSLDRLVDPGNLEEELAGHSERFMVARHIALLPLEQNVAVNKVLYIDESKVYDHDYIYGISTLHKQLKDYYNNVYIK